jgi:hypothetical protein
LKLTLDSSEPLEDAMRVVGALYGVTLALSGDGQDATETPKEATGNSTSTKRRTATKKASARKTPLKAAAAKVQPKQPETQPEQAVASGSTGSPSNADLRIWARHNGFTVSDRGRVPAAIVTAYRNAHRG